MSSEITRKHASLGLGSMEEYSHFYPPKDSQQCYQISLKLILNFIKKSMFDSLVQVQMKSQFVLVLHINGPHTLLFPLIVPDWDRPLYQTLWVCTECT